MQSSRAGHTMQLSQTNTRGYVAVCACGWISDVCATLQKRSINGARARYDYDGARARASAQHGRHVLDVGPIPYTLPPRQFVGVVMNTKRFGHY